MLIVYIICCIAFTICALGNLFLYYFTCYCLTNRETLRLGYSQTKATFIDLVVITLLPVIVSGLIYIIFYEAIYKNILR